MISGIAVARGASAGVVGDIPTRALQDERCLGDGSLGFELAALFALSDGPVGDLLDYLEIVATRVAVIFVNGHLYQPPVPNRASYLVEQTNHNGIKVKFYKRICSSLCAATASGRSKDRGYSHQSELTAAAALTICSAVTRPAAASTTEPCESIM